MAGLDAVFNKKHAALNHKSVNVDIEEDSSCSPPQPPEFCIVFQGKTYNVVWLEEEGDGGFTSPAPVPAKALNVQLVEERVGGRVLLSNGCLFENPEDMPLEQQQQVSGQLSPGSGRRASGLQSQGASEITPNPYIRHRQLSL